MGTLSLFGEEPLGVASRLRPQLAALAAEGVYIGTSSWKYEGWMGQIYTPERYSVRGRFSQKRFEAECLAEYAETFPVVCGDFTFYQFPSPEYWRRLFGSAPATLRYAFKVPEEITVKTFPSHPRYGARGGAENPTFLDAGLFSEGFLGCIEPWRERVASLILEFGQFPKGCYAGVEEFLEELEPFLGALPDGFRYSVEIRNEEFLSAPYFACLRRHRVSHVFNAWTRMPALEEQIEIEDARTADFLLVRALLRKGRPYEQAVERFSPYREVQDENPAGREALRRLIREARDRRQPAYIFVNNRFEGSAPGTIEAIAG